MVASIEVSIMSQNVWFILIASIPAPERIPGIVAGLRESSYDILCLQEVWSSAIDTTYLDQMLDGLRDMYPYNVKYQPEALLPGKLYDSGLLTLSKYPIADFAFHTYGNSSGVDSLANKGVVMAHLEIPTGNNTKADLIVANTHLNAGGGVQYAQTVEAMTALDRFLDSLGGKVDLSTVPVIAAGDFNTDEREDDQVTITDEYKKMMEALGPESNDLYRTVNGNETLGLTTDSSRIDFVFGISGNYTVIEADVDSFVTDDPDNILSDHLAPYAVIDIPGDTPILDSPDESENGGSDEGDKDSSYSRTSGPFPLMAILLSAVCAVHLL
eukprot:scaffold184_cov125-Cylindrotheca_fusiformis.AAC.13